MNTMRQVIIVILILTGCSSANRHGFDLSALRSAVSRNESVNLNKFTPFAWDTVHVFAPYAPPDAIRAETGKDVVFPHSSSEGYCLLVFLADRAVVASLEIARKDADFSRLFRSGGYPAKEALFTVKLDASGWKYLEKANKAAAGNGAIAPLFHVAHHPRAVPEQHR